MQSHFVGSTDHVAISAKGLSACVLALNLELIVWPGPAKASKFPYVVSRSFTCTVTQSDVLQCIGVGHHTGTTAVHGGGTQ